MDLVATLQTFLRVAETGSFSAVATERGVTQPAISRQITALEQQLEARLFERSTHAVVLTEEGRDLVTTAQDLVDAAETLRNSVGRRRGAPAGRVRVSVPVPLGSCSVAKSGPCSANARSFQSISSCAIGPVT
jgi:DNA-binding transcriptional LysR family regulator